MTTISLPSSLRCSKSKCGENVKSRLIYLYIYKLQQSLTSFGALADIYHRGVKLLHICGFCVRIVGVGRWSLPPKLRTFIYTLLTEQYAYTAPDMLYTTIVNEPCQLAKLLLFAHYTQHYIVSRLISLQVFPSLCDCSSLKRIFSR